MAPVDDLLPDLSRYWHHVDHLDMSDAEKIELINMVFRTMQNGVDRAFRADPVHLAITDRTGKRARHDPSVIDLPSDGYREVNLTQTFNHKKGTTKND